MKKKLKDLSLSDLISLKSHILWCRENMEDTVDDFNEKEIFRKDFSIKIDAIEMEIRYKKEKINFENTFKDVKVKKENQLIEKALCFLEEAEEDRVEHNNGVANHKVNMATKLIKDALIQLKKS